MNTLDYIIISVVVVWIIVAIGFMVRAKRKGKRGCCGGCNSCSVGCNKMKEKK